MKVRGGKKEARALQKLHTCLEHVFNTCSIFPRELQVQEVSKKTVSKKSLGPSEVFGPVLESIELKSSE